MDKTVNLCSKNTKKYDVLVPIIKDDLTMLRYILPYWKEYLPLKKIVFVGPEEIQKELKKIRDIEWKYINENKMIPLTDIRAIICDCTGEHCPAVQKAGWYLQQFIKMQYAVLCEDEYYLIWDADTVPLHNIVMEEHGKPVFDMKTEHHQPYFDTICRLLDKKTTNNQKSFISEHMLVHCRTMQELIATISSRENIPGKVWYEKVIRAIEPRNIAHSGFSEFETYGVFTMTYHPELYSFRNWRSERCGHLLFDVEKLRQSDINWMSREYDALSFEKSLHYSTRMKKILKWRMSHILKFTTYLRMMKLYDGIIKRVYKT